MIVQLRLNISYAYQFVRTGLLKRKIIKIGFNNDKIFDSGSFITVRIS